MENQIEKPVYETESAILSFSGSGNFFLCDDYAAPIKIGIAVYPSVRAATLAHKTRDHRIKTKIRNAITPADLKEIERGIISPSHWTKEYIIAKMTELTMQKFLKHPELKTRLLATKPKRLTNQTEPTLQRFEIDEVCDDQTYADILMNVREQL
jgi:predicted NAD-dependent protein-ADP-ribosyltransferase YbiA (DUF1768 family)